MFHPIKTVNIDLFHYSQVLSTAVNELKLHIENTVAQLGITLLRHSAHELRVSNQPVGQLNNALSIQPPATLSSTKGSSTVFGAASLTLSPLALQRVESLQSAQASVPTSALVANNGGLELIASPAPMRASIGSSGAHFEYNTASMIASARTEMREFVEHLSERPYNALGDGVRASLRTEMEERFAALDTKVSSASDLLSLKADEADTIAQLQQSFGAASESLGASLGALEHEVHDTLTSAAAVAEDPLQLEEQLQRRQRETQRLRGEMDSAGRRLEAFGSQGSTFNTALVERVTAKTGEIDSPARPTFVEAAVEGARLRFGELGEQLEAGADGTSRLVAVAAQFERDSRALESDVERSRGRVEPLLAETPAPGSIERLRALRTQLSVEAIETLPALEGALEALEHGALLALLVAFSVDRPEHLMEALRTRDALPLAAIPVAIREHVEKTRAISVSIVELRNSVQKGIRELSEREQQIRDDADSQADAFLHSLASTLKTLEEQSRALEQLCETPLTSPLQTAVEGKLDALQAIVGTVSGVKQQLVDSERSLVRAKLEFEGVGNEERLAAAQKEQADASEALRAFETAAVREEHSLDELLVHCTSFNDAVSSASERLSLLEEQLSAGVNPQQIDGLLHAIDQLGAEELPKWAALGSALKSRLSELDPAVQEVDEQLSSLSTQQKQIAERAKALRDERAALLEEYAATQSQLVDLEECIHSEQDALDDENLEASRQRAERCAADSAAAFDRLDALIARLFADSNGAEALAEREQLAARRAALQNLLDEWRADIESLERTAREREAAAGELARLAAELDSWLRALEVRVCAFDAGDGDSLRQESVDAYIRQLDTLGAEIELRARPLLEQIYKLHSESQSDEGFTEQLTDFEQRLDSLSQTRDSKLSQFNQLKATLLECLTELNALKELFDHADKQLKQHLEGLNKSGASQESLDSLVSALEVHNHTIIIYPYTGTSNYLVFIIYNKRIKIIFIKLLK